MDPNNLPWKATRRGSMKFGSGGSILPKSKACARYVSGAVGQGGVGDASPGAHPTAQSDGCFAIWRRIRPVPGVEAHVMGSALRLELCPTVRQS